MKILIIGKNGQLGRSIHKIVTSKINNNQSSDEFIFVGKGELDLSSKNNIHLYFEINKFDIIVCFKTIYYLADNIDVVINNFQKYLKKEGFIFISYNSKKDSYSNKFLTDLKLRSKLTQIFNEIYTVEINRELYETKNKDKNTLFVFKKLSK